MYYKVFISYRRSDSEGVAGRIYDRLIQRVPTQNVFIDVGSIAKGADFVEAMAGQVSAADIVLAIIGTNWIGAKDESGKGRLDNPDDPVRLELSKAIEESKVIIPVLVGRADMPSPRQLPECLMALTRRNAERVSHENFHADVERLIQSVDLAASRIANSGLSGRSPNPQSGGLAWNGRQGDRRLEHDVEIAEFEAAARSEDAEELRAHIAKWPNGITLSSALLELEKRDWEYVFEVKNVELLQWFIANYPNSNRAKKAAQLIAHMTVMSGPMTSSEQSRKVDARERVTLDGPHVEREGSQASRRAFLFVPLGAAIVGGTGYLLWKYGGIYAPALRPVVTVSGRTGFSGSVFSPDGTKFIAGADDDVVREWDSRTGAALRSFKGLAGPISWVCYSRDSQFLAAASMKNSAIVWSTKDGRIAGLLAGHREGVQFIEFSPDGSTLVTCSDDGTSRLWEVGSWKSIAVLGNGNTRAKCVRFSPDGSKIVVALADATVAVWDVKQRSRLLVLNGHQYIVWTAAFSPNGRKIVTGSEDKTVRLWDSHSGDALTTLVGHSDAINHVEFSPNGAYIVSAAADSTVRLWDAAKGTQIAKARVHGSTLSSACFDSTGQRIVTASSDGTCVVLEL